MRAVYAQQRRKRCSAGAPLLEFMRDVADRHSACSLLRGTPDSG